MFQSIREARRKNEINRHFSEFQKSFTYDQKEAVLACLWALANMDDNFHFTEKEFLRITAETLGFKLSYSNPYDFSNVDPFLSAKIISTFNESQMHWFIITSLSMIHADGVGLDVEFQFLDGFFQEIGISMDTFKTAIGKHEAMLRDMGISSNF